MRPSCIFLAFFISFLVPLAQAVSFHEDYQFYRFDYNGDGLNDILLLAEEPWAFIRLKRMSVPVRVDKPSLVLEQTTDGTYRVLYDVSEESIEHLAKHAPEHHIFYHDINGDGALDVLFQGKGSNAPSFYFFNPGEVENLSISGYFSESQFGVAPDDSQTSWAFEDVNLDGRIDIKILKGNEIAAFLEGGTTGFQITANQIGEPIAHGDEVGVVAGQYGVSPNGGFTYTIPVTLPPGVNGLQPNISLNFNSQAGNGVMGMGWSFTGESVISRCPKTLAKDNDIASINYLSNTFCFDGIPLKVNGTDEYVLETEGDVRKIIYEHNGRYFKVYKKDGSLWIYGHTPESKITRMSGLANFNGADPIFSWSLSKITDLHGNEMHYTYYTDHAAGTQNLASISYNLYRINFHYQSREDIRPVYLGVKGPFMKQPALLDKIQVQQQSNNMMISQYDLRYGTDEMKRPVVLGITQCGASANQCVPETTFDWNWVQKGFERTQPGFANAINDFIHQNANYPLVPDHDMQAHHLSRFKIGDFNADGLSDIYWVAGVSEPDIIDVNNMRAGTISAAQDKIFINQGDGEYEVRDGLMNAATVFQKTVSSPGYPLISHSVDWTHLIDRIMIADFNGDGLSDIYYYGDGNSVQYKLDYMYQNSVQGEADISMHVPGQTETGHIYLAQADGTFQQAGEINLPLYDADDIKRLRTGDFNGDAVTDLLYLGNAAKNEPMRIYYMTQDGLPLRYDYDQSLFPGDEAHQAFDLTRVQLGDFNGDAITDIYLMARHTGPHNQQSNLSEHDAILFFNHAGQYNVSYVEGLHYSLSNEASELGLDASRFKVVDLNGDGFSDVYFIKGKGSTERDDIFLSEGNGSFRSYTGKGANTFVESAIENQARSFNQLKFADFNGDGMVDLYQIKGWGTEEPDQVFYNYFNGEDFFHHSPIRTLVTWVSGNNQEALNDYSSIILADFDGDAQLDVYQMPLSSTSLAKSSTGHVYISKRVHKQMTQVTNAYGSVVQPEYGLLTDESVYDFSPQANTYPDRKIRPPLQVVTSLRTDTGLSHDNGPILNEISYEYMGYLVNLRGYGALGFSKMIQHEHFTQPLANGGTTNFTHSTHTQYSQDYINRQSGLPIHIETYLGNQLLSRTRATYTTSSGQPGFGSSAFAKVTQPHTKATWAWHLDGSFKSLEIREHNYFFDRLDKEVICLTSNNLFSGGTQGMPNCNGDAFYKETFDYQYWWHNHYHQIYADGTDVTIRNLVRTKTAHYEMPSHISIPGYAMHSTTRTTSYEYINNTGQLHKEIREPDIVEERLVTTYAYDARGLLYNTGTTGSVPDSNGNLLGVHFGGSNTQYDSVGRIISKTNAEGHKKEYRYEDARFPWLVTASKDIGGLTTDYAYDAMGRQYRVTNPLGINTTTSQSWCNGGCLGNATFYTKVTSAQSGDLYQYFDRLGREIGSRQQTFGGDVYSRTEFDQRGQVYKQTDRHFPGQANYTQHFYDPAGRLIESHYPDGTKNAMQYQGFTTITRDAQHYGQSSFSHKEVVNIKGQRISAVDTNHNEMRYTYDVLGNLVETLDPAGHRIETEYDHLGRKIRLKDPDKGQYTYTYNLIGHLKQQIDPDGYAIDMWYDKLGRMTKRIDYGRHFFLGYTWKPDYKIKSYWIYDTKVPGMLSTETINGYRKEYYYDQYNRLSGTTTLTGEWAHLSRNDDIDTALDNLVYAFGPSVLDTMHRLDSSQTYDVFGRLSSIQYPGGLYTESYQYDNYSTLTHRKNADTQAVLWALKETDAEGNITREEIAGNIETSRYYHPITGRLEGLVTTQGNTPIQNLDFEYNQIGMLTHRHDNQHNQSEHFEYDALNRLTKSTLTTPSLPNGIEQHQSYDALGNIRSKTNIGNYQYGGETNQDHCGTNTHAGPHAVTRITGNQNSQYCYDKKGNQLTGDGRTIEYNLFNKPTKITTGNTTTQFSYGPDRSRYQRIDQINNTQINTRYIDNLEIVDKDGVLTHKYNLGFAQIIIENGVARTNYLIKDHLGSLTAILSDTGQLTTQSYDPWGKRRQGLNWAADINLLTHIDLTQSVPDTQRGYTGHEHLDQHKLIHMNGRIYDPTIGRFLSADPLIQAPGNLQSFNRYTYVMNNPLGYTDPSGYSWVSKKWKQIRRVAVTIGSFFGGAALCGGNPQCGFIAANASYSYRKAKDHGASTHQALRNGVTSGVSAGTLIKVTGWVGSEIQIGFEKFWAASNLTAFAANVTAHALVGCAAARGFSESCRAGAAAAFGQAIIKPFVFGAIGNGVTGNWKVVAAGIAGGLAAKAADPDADPYFGAFIAAMGMYYNGCSGRPCRTAHEKGSTLGEQIEGAKPLIALATTAFFPVRAFAGAAAKGFRWALGGAKAICFVKGTLVHTKHGLKPIEEIKIGDLVASKNEETGETEWKSVTQLFQNKDKAILNITFSNEHADIESLGVTYEHPFWVKGKGWIAANNLDVGDYIVDIDGKPLAIEAIVPEQELHITYNFEVADFHTYFVGKQGVWVHNTCGHTLNRSVLKAFRKNPGLQEAFEKAIGKGSVGATGQSGIKIIKGSKVYTHEVKFLSKQFGDVRIFGRKLDNGSFEWLKVGNHKTL